MRVRWSASSRRASLPGTARAASLAVIRAERTATPDKPFYARFQCAGGWNAAMMSTSGNRTINERTYCALLCLRHRHTAALLEAANRFPRSVSEQTDLGVRGSQRASGSQIPAASPSPPLRLSAPAPVRPAAGQPGRMPQRTRPPGHTIKCARPTVLYLPYTSFSRTFIDRRPLPAASRRSYGTKYIRWCDKRKYSLRLGLLQLRELARAGLPHASQGVVNERTDCERRSVSAGSQMDPGRGLT